MSAQNNKSEDQFVPAAPAATQAASAPVTAPTGQSTSIMAILGLVFSFFIPLLGLIFSIVGLGQTKNNKQGGRGLAVAGLILSSIFMLLGILWIVFVVIVGISADKTANDAFDSYSDSSLSTLATDSKETLTASVGEEVKVGDYTLTVLSVKRPYVVENMFMQPDEGKEYVEVRLKIVNNDDSSNSYSDYDFKLRNSTGVESYTTFVDDTADRLSSASLAAGGNVTGTIVFEVEKTETDLTLLYNPSLFSDQVAEIKL